MTQTHSGGCQCGKVRYEVQMDIGEVISCNCSRCGRLGSLLAFAPATQFKLLTGDADLTIQIQQAHDRAPVLLNLRYSVIRDRDASEDRRKNGGYQCPVLG